MKMRWAWVVLALVVMSVIAGSWSAPPVRAATSTVTWTSTADFDGGTKGTPQTPGAWSVKASLPFNESDAAGLSYNGKLYVIGGANSGANTWTNNTQIYTAASDSWSSGAVMPTKRLGMGAVLWADRIYVAGGQVTGGGSTNVTEYYNTTADTWTTAHVLPAATAAGTCGTPWNGFVYILYGGATYQYNPLSDTWAVKAASTLNGNWCTAATIGNFIYMLEGVTGKVGRYDPVANTWNDAWDTMPYQAYAGPQSNPVYNGKVWWGFGAGAGVAASWQALYRLFWSYDPVAKVWTQQTTALYPRDGVVAGWIGSKFYVVAGRNSQAVASSGHNEQFDPTLTTADGNPGVETSTDNSMVASGSFESASVTGDTFVTPKPNANSFKWNLTVTSQGTCQPVIAGGVLTINTGDAVSSGFCALMSNASFTGNLDIRVRTVSPGAAVVDFHILNERCPYYACDSTVDGILIQSAQSPRNVAGFTVTNGVVTACGPTATGQPSTLWERFTLTASNNSWGWYISPDGVTWTPRGFCTNAISGPWYVILGTQFNVAGAAISYDDLTVNTGSGSATTYRSSASWTSPTQTYAQQVVSQVTVDYTGATAAETIASLSVVDSTGAVIIQDSNAISSGASFTWSVPFMSQLEQSWGIQVALAGDGAGSVSVQDVIVTLVSPPGGSGGRPSYAVSCSYSQLLLTWTCADATDYTGFYVSNVWWVYDGVTVANVTPGSTVSFRPGSASWFSPPSNHTLQLHTYGGLQDTYTLSLRTEEWQVWVLLAVIAVLVGFVAGMKITRGADRDVYFLSPPSSYRTAWTVEEYPKGWRSYQRPGQDGFARHRDRKGKTRWVVYGLRAATGQELERTGRRYVGEPVTVRERMT